MKPLHLLLIIVCLTFGLPNARAGLLSDLTQDDYDYEEKPEWKENEVVLPPFPEDADLIDFYVSPTARNRFFVDLAHLSIGSDGITRYTLVIISPSGARNVTREGMRCATTERRIYASGRADKSWSKTRAERWFPIREAVTNRHHAALYQDFFCPGGVIESRLENLLRALKKEGSPLRD